MSKVAILLFELHLTDVPAKMDSEAKVQAGCPALFPFTGTRPASPALASSASSDCTKPINMTHKTKQSRRLDDDSSNHILQLNVTYATGGTCAPPRLESPVRFTIGGIAAASVRSTINPPATSLHVITGHSPPNHRSLASNTIPKTKDPTLSNPPSLSPKTPKIHDHTKKALNQQALRQANQSPRKNTITHSHLLNHP